MPGTRGGDTAARAWPFIVCVLGLAVSGAALVLTVPRLFGPVDPGTWILAGALSVVVVVLAVLGFVVRPAAARSS